MAVLQKIRDRAGIFVIIFVGVALVLFIVDHQTLQSIFYKRDTMIGEINGKKLDYNKDYLRHYNFHRNYISLLNYISTGKFELQEGQDDQVSNFAWNDLVSENVFDPIPEKIGINISDEELAEYLYGAKMHYIIYNNPIFYNQERTALDTARVRQFFESPEDSPEYNIIADYIKRNIIKDVIKNKFDNLISKGTYIPTAFAKMDYEQKNTKFDVEVLTKSYSTIKDDDVNVSIEDLKAYYNEHLYLFENVENSRDLDYVVFDVIPSSGDTLTVKQKIEELYAKALELSKNNDTLRKREIPYFINKDEIPNIILAIDESFFNKPKGTITEIILDNNTYTFSEIVDVDERADSIKMEYKAVFVSPEQDIERCREIADSLIQAEKNPTNILAIQELENDSLFQNTPKYEWQELGDWQAENTGFLIGIENQLGKTLSSNVYKANPGYIENLETENGIFIFKLTDITAKHRKIKLYTENREIHPSNETQSVYKREAEMFLTSIKNADDFENAVNNAGLYKRIATVKELDKRISNIEQVREVVQWAFKEDTKTGSIYDRVFYSSDKYIVFKVSGVKTKGIAAFEEVEAKIKLEVIKNKKAETLMAGFDIKSNNMATIAQSNGLVVDTVTNIGFSDYSVRQFGIEPKIIGTVVAIEQNKVSDVIKGNSGVYVVNVISKVSAPEKSDYTSEQLGLMRVQAGQVMRISEALKKKANIQDYRIKFM